MILPLLFLPVVFSLKLYQGLPFAFTVPKSILLDDEISSVAVVNQKSLAASTLKCYGIRDKLLTIMDFADTHLHIEVCAETGVRTEGLSDKLYDFAIVVGKQKRVQRLFSDLTIENFYNFMRNPSIVPFSKAVIVDKIIAISHPQGNSDHFPVTHDVYELQVGDGVVVPLLGEYYNNRLKVWMVKRFYSFSRSGENEIQMQVRCNSLNEDIAIIPNARNSILRICRQSGFAFVPSTDYKLFVVFENGSVIDLGILIRSRSIQEPYLVEYNFPPQVPAQRESMMKLLLGDD